MRQTLRLLIACTLLTLAASQAQAQARWDSPFLVSPRPAPGLGLFLVDLHGAGVGVLVTWLPSPTSWGFRAGLAERSGPDEGIAVVAGADVSVALTRSTSDMPLDIDAVLGIGAGIGDDLIISIPLGLSIGHTFAGQGATFTPYATPRVVVDARFGDGENMDLDFAVDLGLDLRIQPNWLIRFGGTIGDREAIAIGIVF